MVRRCGCCCDVRRGLSSFDLVVSMFCLGLDLELDSNSETIRFGASLRELTGKANFLSGAFGLVWKNIALGNFTFGVFQGGLPCLASMACVCPGLGASKNPLAIWAQRMAAPRRHRKGRLVLTLGPSVS